jgi:lipoate---protein ligase
MKLEILDTGIKSAAENMEIDQQLLLSLKEDALPILHFYDWQKPSATFGYFCHPDRLLHPEIVDKYGVDLAKRPTGGGVIFHQFDFAFSFLLPASHPSFSLNTLENYGFVNRIIADILQRFLDRDEQLELLRCTSECSIKNPDEKLLRNFCMALPTVYDVISNGRKLAGGAQRRTKQGFLHQASIALMLPPESFLNEILCSPNAVANAMQESSYPLLGDDAASQQVLKSTKDALKKALATEFAMVC